MAGIIAAMTPAARRTAVLAALCGLLLISCSPANPAPVDGFVFGYQPLWPFADQQEADQSTADWHADPGATALAFTRDFLDFNEIDRIAGATEDDDEAWVDVGYRLPDDRVSTAATIHLARFGPAADAPWEVVGTRDEVLTLQAPPYGSLVRDTVEAGGRITGIDESLHLQIRQSGQDRALGDYCCLPAGGQDQPWSAQVSMTRAPRPGTVTVVVSTGGHIAEVERFAVTGLRVQ